MLFKRAIFFVGCVVTWAVLLPLFVIGGGTVLLSYAVLAEIGDFLKGGTNADSQDAGGRGVRLAPAKH